MLWTPHPALVQDIRHGKSAAQEAMAAGHTFGGGEVKLSALGETEAEALGRSWRGTEPPDAMLSSPLLRAVRTAEIARDAAGWKAEIVQVLDLREQEYGELAHLSDQQIVELHPEEAARKSRQGWWYYQPPGGESWEQVVARLRPVLRKIWSEYRGKRIMIFGHCVVNQCKRMIIERLSPAELLSIDLADVANCSTTTYESNGRRLVRKGVPYHRPEEVLTLHRAQH